MKIRVLGGGPAGLYFSILVRKARPDAEVVVYERNRADDTFGWGVVFSDETLGNLEEADAETYAAIRENFAYWDAIDVHTWADGHRVVRSGGHGFCGIGRMRLLLILQARARELGVALRFEEQVDDIEALRRDCDLFVAADGINSRTRGLFSDVFKPSIRKGDARFVWLGTKQCFEAFTFSFRENEHGVFQIHAYQFDESTSTFIVECDEATWRAAGLDAATEADTVAYCQSVFEDELGGHPLLPNRSDWIQFRTVSCERWHHENVVLLGDAAHTAHFSVGSGTKMAMEDSIALANALGSNADVEGALLAYEEDRRPLVGRTQKAAAQSEQWFAESKRHLSHAPERLTFSLLSRTRRVTHENLRLREPSYIEGLDHWFMAKHGMPAEGGVVPPMFCPFQLRDLKLGNRVVVSPMCQYSATDGVPNDWHMVHLGSRALGGAGLVFTEMTNVSADGRITPGCTGLYDDAQEAAWSRIVQFVHERSSAAIGIQLAHAGRKGATKLLWEGMDRPLESGGWPLLAPSPIPWRADNVVPKEMTREDMVLVRDAFVASAERAIRCGFDLLEVHLAHGYLLSSFLTPVSNQRTDDYGGDLRSRARFPLEVVEAVRAVWTGPLSVRISATDWVEGGFGIEEAVALSGWLKAVGVDLIDVSAGQTSPDAKPVYGRAFQTPFSERIRNDVGVPTMTVGNIYDHDRINTILLAGRADLVALARAHLADPYLTLHAAAELGYEGTQWPKQYGSARTLLPRMFGDGD